MNNITHTIMSCTSLILFLDIEMPCLFRQTAMKKENFFVEQEQLNIGQKNREMGSQQVRYQ